MNTKRMILPAAALLVLLTLPAAASAATDPQTTGAHRPILTLSAAATEQTGVITGTNVNLRARPTTASGRLRYLNTGDVVTVTGQTGDWTAVTVGGQSGYVYGRYVRITAAAPAAVNLRYGSRGAEVKTLQTGLILLGYLNDTADGVFGSRTRAAVVSYQRVNGLAADGVAGRLTRAAVTAEADRVNTVVSTARSFLGTAYVYGGSTPQTGFDCSGLVQWAHKAAGVSTPRVSYEQAASGAAVPRSRLRAGDVVCFNSPVTHVGVYVGGGKFIHSPKTGDVVKITSLSAMELTAIRRYTGRVAG